MAGAAWDSTLEVVVATTIEIRASDGVEAWTSVEHVLDGSVSALAMGQGGP